MSEKTDIVARLRNGAGLILDDVGGVQINLGLLDEAADEIEQLRMERDKAREESSCANDQVNKLMNEVRW
jgi:hypothetical protein